MNKKFWIKRCIGFVILAIAFMALLSYVVMRLWNGVLVDITSVKPVTYQQAFGILILSKILFGGFKKGWGGHKNHMEWKEKMKAKLEGMNPEEREKFKQEWRNRCRTWGRVRDTKSGTE